MTTKFYHKRYTLHEPIGSGSAGTVYRATDRLTGQAVALKLVTEPTDATAHGVQYDTRWLRARLSDEFRLLASLQHPHIIQVADYGVSGEHPYLTMQLLSHAVEITTAAQQTDLQGKLRLMAQVLYAMDYLHHRRILHRDIKPSNIHVVDNHAYLLDFGLAVEGQNAAPVGTLLYIAPEMLRGGRATHATDVYALGCVFFEMLTGTHLYQLPKDADNTDLRRAIVEQKPDWRRILPDAAVGDALAVEIRDIVRSMLANDPNARLTDTGRLLARVMALLDEPFDLTPDALLNTTRFIGRREEQQRLHDALDRVRMAMADVWAFVKAEATSTAIGSMWLIGGESGVGKSRLLQEFAAYALTSGCLVLQGSALEEADPQTMWLEPLRRLILDIDLSTAEAATLKNFIPDIDTLIGRTVGPAGPADNVRAVVLSLFRRLEQPTVLILDNIQWATRAIVHELIALLPTLPLVIVAGFRDDEYPRLYSEFPSVQHVSLSRFSYGEVAELVHSLLPQAPDRFITSLFRQTEGNAFFLIETLRTLLHDDTVLEDLLQQPLPQTVLPSGVFPLLERRLQQLSEEDQTLLKMAATLGAELDLTVIQCLNNFEPLDGWLQRCRAVALLTTGNTRWQFVHDKLRAALLATITDADRAALYRRVAIAKASVHSENPAEAQLLMQLWRVAGDTYHVFRYAVHAARYARSGADFPNASKLYYAAREGVAYVSCRLLLEHTAVLYELGDYAAALHTAEQAINISTTSSDMSCMAHIMYQKAQVHLAQHHYEQATALGVDALHFYNRLGATRHAARALVLLGRTYAEMGSVRLAVGYHTAALGRFIELDDINGILAAHTMLGVAHYIDGDYDAALAKLEYAQDLAKTHAHPDHEARALYHAGIVLMAKGRVLGAVSRLVQVLEMIQLQGRIAFEASIKVRLAHCYRLLNEDHTARRFYGEALNDSLRMGLEQAAGLEVMIGVAHMAIAEGKVEIAARLVGRLASTLTLPQEVRIALDALIASLRETVPDQKLLQMFNEGQDAPQDDVVQSLQIMLSA